MREYFITHAAVRLQQYEQNQLLLYHLTLHRKFIISPFTAAVVIMFAGGEYVANIYKELGKYEKIDSQQLQGIIHKLLQSRIICTENDKSHILAKNIANKWSGYNWFEAADYHLATFDYPFIEDPNGTYQQQDNARMMEYLSKESDFNRSKEYSEVIKDIPLPVTIDALSELSIPFQQITECVKENGLSADHIKAIFSIIFGKLRIRECNEPNKADIVRKTSPSGGSRHPTEGYIIIREQVQELEKGIYHFSVKKNTLEMIHDTIPDNLEEMVPGVFRGPFIPKVIIILTSLFERNMFRYREPRTFRTIFIDSGHIAANIKIVCRALGIKYYAHSYIDEEKVESMLNINQFDEGAIYSMALA